jgi:rSAM/selenodomain-associated transferase 1
MNNHDVFKKQNFIIQIIAKAPLAGLAKTRLIPALGAAGAAHVAEKMLNNTLSVCAQACCVEAEDYELACELCLNPAPDSEVWRGMAVINGFASHAQVEGDLGARMAAAVERGLSSSDGVILLGTDCPEISAQTLHWAGNALLSHDACLIPSVDGGYVLLGLRRFDSSLFTDIPWSSAEVAALTRNALRESNMCFLEHPVMHDIDEPQDLMYLPSTWLPKSVESGI